MTIPDYHLGDKAKAAIGTTKIKGLNALKVPGIIRASIKVEEFDRDFDFEVPTSASWEKGSMSGNYVRGDDTGQRALRTKLFDNEGLADLRLYEDVTNFWAPDLANDANSQIFVAGMPGPEITKAGVIPFSADLMAQGLLALFTAHIGGVTLDFVAGVGEAADTITDSESGFVTSGFEEGQTLIIEGSTSNDTVTEALITTVAAGVLTLSTAGGVITTEIALAGTLLHGGKL
jgi:hypothetical protein